MFRSTRMKKVLHFISAVVLNVVFSLKLTISEVAELRWDWALSQHCVVLRKSANIILNLQKLAKSIDNLNTCYSKHSDR